MSKLGDELIEGMQEALDHARGNDTDVRQHQITISTPDVKTIRQNLEMTQNEFAKTFGFSTGSVRNWEQGHRRPERSARLLLNIIARKPNCVLEVLSDLDEVA